MKMQRKIMAAIITAVLLLTACTGAPGEVTVNAEPRTELILSGIMLDPKIREQVVNYNKTNKDYYITIEDYVQYEYPEAVEQRNLRIISGSPPDIMIVSGVDYCKYVDKDIFLDLSSYYEQDQAIDRADIYENVLESIKVEDRLYGITSEFALRMLVTEKRFLPEALTFERMNEIQSTSAYPLLVTAGQDELLLYLTLFYFDQFIDWESAACNFSNQQFFELLEMVKNCPPIIDPNIILDKKENGEPIFFPVHMTDVYMYQKYSNFFGGELICTGYPDGEGNLMHAVPTNIFAVSSQTKHSQAAWDFISLFLEADYQSDYADQMAGITMSRTALQKLLTNAQHEGPVNNESFVEDRLELGDYHDEIYAITAQTAEEFTTLLESDFRAEIRYDQAIIDIIVEECGYYLNENSNENQGDDRTAQQVADSINNRVTIYLQEQE
ncbi:MAG: ABC transporter substrate-binding protein [Lachnospiraceae bacterium]|jgi:ABC-type glycerol-3-phosphate transport system substrate-binding protein|nr:ABC transporter substrate-binding protein [Lachnospiraceae bacterium]